ncbi:CBO0543 family protein [Paenisporosarcina sp. TG20]|uniref:CBO0543 family protein n=1 Tax=Paenisporosarcina sp. TG20 TaxID=1211706 RepID=UPI00030A285B|nr:CBO0543 family protein [Paenisporosarcina sp. TG20]
MHVLTAIISIVAVFIWGDWRNWKKYHATLLFFALGNLTYNFLTANYFLWKLDGDFLSNHSLTELLYTFIVFPATGLLFLDNYPKGVKKQILHTLQWIFIYAIWEYIFNLTRDIEYQYGWTFWWSVAVLFAMFPMLKLHVKHPLIAYVLFGLTSAVLLWWFDVPVNVPIEER